MDDPDRSASERRNERIHSASLLHDVLALTH